MHSVSLLSVVISSYSWPWEGWIECIDEKRLSCVWQQNLFLWQKKLNEKDVRKRSMGTFLNMFCASSLVKQNICRSTYFYPNCHILNSLFGIKLLNVILKLSKIYISFYVLTTYILFLSYNINLFLNELKLSLLLLKIYFLGIDVMTNSPRSYCLKKKKKVESRMVVFTIESFFF